MSVIFMETSPPLRSDAYCLWFWQISTFVSAQDAAVFF